MIQFEVKEKSTSILMQEGKNYIIYNMNGIDLEFTHAYSLESRPEWIKDSGTGRILIKGLNITLKVTPFNKDGKLQVDFNADFDKPVEMIDYELTLSGQTDFSKTFNYMLATFKEFFKNEVTMLL